MDVFVVGPSSWSCPVLFNVFTADDDGCCSVRYMYVYQHMQPCELAVIAKKEKIINSTQKW